MRRVASSAEVSPPGAQPVGWLRVVSALRHRNFRLYWLGMLASIVGLQVQWIAQSWLVYDITGKPLWLGLVGLSQSSSAIVLSLAGGVLADRVNRLRLLRFTNATMVLLALALALLTATGTIRVWHIMVVAFLGGIVQAFDQPARMALIPHLIDRRDLMNAVALGSAIWQGSRIIGPAVAGVAYGIVGPAACFAGTAVGFGFMVAALGLIRLAAAESEAEQATPLRSLVQGISFILRNTLFSLLIGMAFFNSIFGMSYVTLLPVFAKDILHAGPEGLGFLGSASGAGALMGTVLVASLGDFRYKGRLILGGGLAFGLLVAAFALSRWLYLSLALIVLVGITNSLYMTTTNTVVQLKVPDKLRGRVMSVFGLTWHLMPLGGFQAGLIAQFLGAPFAVTIGAMGVALLAIAVAIATPTVRRVGVDEGPAPGGPPSR